MMNSDLGINAKFKVLSGFVVLIILISSLYGILITPFIIQEKSLKSNLDSRKKLWELRMATIDKIDSLENRLREAEESLKVFDRRFLVEKELPLFFADLRALAGKNNVKISDLTIREKKTLKTNTITEGNQYAEVPVNVSFNGNYMDTIRLLSELRQKGAIYSVISISLTTEGAEQNSVNTQMQLMLYLI